MLHTELKETKPQTYNGVGSMHKYWGKKPHNVISKLIEMYTEKGDVVLDPFMGSGIAIVEALASNRNAVGVDLNPFSCLLTKVSITPVDPKKLEITGYQIIDSALSKIKDIYTYPCDCGKDSKMISAVRTNSNEVTRIKLKCNDCGAIERDVTKNDLKLTKVQDSYQPVHFYPKNNLIHNSRINAKKGMTVEDLFTKRNLFVCSELLYLIREVEDEAIREALLISFTANLPNASRLTPIIKQRGPMNPGAWMTGFYVGKDFLEQNVLWYFENRLKKTIKAKKEILSRKISPKQSTLLNANAENLVDIKSNSVDFIFTDPPYGDAIPYFEQSLLYNSWLELEVNYEDEIVISDSKERSKNEVDYIARVSNSFQEFYRVLKLNKNMVLTFHNMDGAIWHNFAKVIMEAGFEIKDVIPLYQKTSTPRQLNRMNSIKCDMVLSFEKVKPYKIKLLNSENVENLIIENLLKFEKFSTDQAFSVILSSVYKTGLPETPISISQILKENFIYDSDGWKAIKV